MKYHPLLLKESQKHYDIKGNTSNIIEFECDNTIGGALGVCSYHIIKYTNRQKGQDELDAKKVKTFEDWRELLIDLIHAGYDYRTSLRYDMQKEYPDLKYTLED